MKKRKHIDRNIKIPGIGNVQIKLGSTPSSGATVSASQLEKEFKRAAQKGLLPPPLELQFDK